MTLASGSRLGPYEIVAPLGAGGMGQVYRAKDPRLGRDVAIKVVTKAHSSDADHLRRFEVEARAVAALSHPNVLAIFDIGLGEVPFLVTELLDGETLRGAISRGPFSTRRTIDIGLQIVAGLGAAHARGIVHRDLKPENIFITSEGRVKILDFGLAKKVVPIENSEHSPTLTHTTPGAVMGTVGYMAPEQVRGYHSDHRADIFATGAVLFEMLTGQRAFRGQTFADRLAAVLHDPPSELVFGPDTPPALAATVRRCLEKDANNRFSSAQELGRALESISEIGAQVAVPPARPDQASIAVLPFANLSADADNQYFSDGLTEELINALARLHGLRVTSRTSSFRYRGGDVDVRQIGRDLGVGAILEGSVRRAGERLRITAQLVNVESGYQIWSERYDRQMTDVFDIQDEIVTSIVDTLAPALLPAAKDAVKRSTENLEAYQLYLKGRYFWNQRSPAVVGTAIRCFEDAIALDPRYALAYAGLADCYSILRVYGWTPTEHSRPRALEAVTKAIELGPDLPEAHLSKALYTFHFEKHWRQARQHFLDALSSPPPVATTAAYFALFLAAAYEFAEARKRIVVAVDLDPHSAMVHFLAAGAECLMADWVAAERSANRALELQPEMLGARWPQMTALAATGRFDQAIELGERVIARSRGPIYIGALAMVYGSAGRLADARRLSQELDERQGRGEYIVPVARLSVHLGLRDTSAVRAALEACVDGGAAPMAVASTNRHLLEGYRSDPEIDRLLDRLHDGARPEPAGA